MTFLIGSDHRGYLLKEAIRIHWPDSIDVGCDSSDPCDYPLIAQSLTAKLSQQKAPFGVLICGTGIGMSIAANRHPSIRAALCTSSEMVEQARRHNDANVLCLAGTAPVDQAVQWVTLFSITSFDGGRHLRRIHQL